MMLYLRVGQSGLGYGRTEELVSALRRFRKTGKRIYAYLESGRTLERVQTNQPRAAAPPSQSAEDWLGLQQIAEAGQIDDQSMHPRQ